MIVNRRHFLRASGTVLAGALTGELFAAPSADTRFLLVFLRGGYDAANLLVPVSSEFYYQSRPSIAIKRTEALAIDSDWGLHPALKDSVYALWQKGEAAFVPFAGTEDLTRSHFETQDSIELGQPLGERRDFGSGFLNRLVSQLKDQKPISFTDQLPIVFRGEAKVANAALRFVGRAGVDARQSDLIAQMYRDTALAEPVTEGFSARDKVMKELSEEMNAASRNAINARNFADQARRLARLLRGPYNLGFVDVGGWDTHVGEGGATGQLATRLEDLGRGLAALADELGPAWKTTVVAVMSEFGRTFRENGNRGTDHGHGTVLWILGGAVRGGRLAGEQVRVERKTLLEDRDFPVLSDYRGVLGGLFGRLYGLSGAQLQQVFPKAAPLELGLL